jgi:hypothetical protein
LGLLVALAVSLAALRAIGALGIERRVGFFAPVWDPDGRHVYWIQRETRGFIWGMGWECFSPPASVYVESDELSLRRLDSTGGSVEVLERFAGSPVLHRVTRHYHGSIFGFLSASVEPTSAGIEFRAKMNVPKVPSSEQWALRGTWAPGRPSGAAWTDGWAGGMGRPEAVLANGVELITVKGEEAFPAAVLAVAADGSYRVLVQNADFDDLYPSGVPPERIAERSNRAQIEHARTFRRVEAELIARYRREGASEVEASLRALDTMEEQGLIPKDPRLVASAVSAPPDGVRFFEIPEDYLRAGLFQDVAAAIAAPGQEVRTGTGTYLKYYDDDVGPRLRAWREAGHDRFGVRTGGRLYLLEVRRFDR